MTADFLTRIDGSSSSLGMKAPVRVATTANISLIGLQTIDGIALAAGDRVLVKNQTDTKQNGIYVASSSVATQWQRDTDFDGPRDATDGTIILSRTGSINAGKFWKTQAGTLPIVFGTTPITFVLSFAPITPTAGYLNVRDFGAVGDGLTDDTAAFQAAIAIQNALGGGIVLAPPGNYSITSTLVISGAVRLVGGGGGPIGGTVLYAGKSNAQQDIILVNFTGQWGTVENMVLYGCGMNGVDRTPFGAGQPVIKFSSGAVSCRLHHLYIWGGGYSVFADVGSGDNFIEDVYGAFAYQDAVCFIRGSSVYINRCKFDQDYPVQFPTGHPTFNTWFPSNHYNVGDIASTNNHYIQCKTAGTSSGIGPPALKNYFVDMPDGGAVWRLVGGTGYSALQFDGAVPTAFASDTDLSGCFAYGLRTSNEAGAPSNPDSLSILRCTAGENIVNGFNFEYGHNIDVTDINIGGPTQNNTTAVAIQSTFQGDIVFKGGVIFQGINGITLGGGINSSFIGVRVAGMAGTGIIVNGGVSQFIISACILGSSSVNGPNNAAINVAAGGSDYYNIVNNIVHGAGSGVTDGGTGIHKAVSGNQ